MTTITATMMDGHQYEVELVMWETVRELKDRLSPAAGLYPGEITLFFDSQVLDDQTALEDVFVGCEELEVVLMRTPTAGTKAIYWYDVWVEASEVTLADLELKDADPWIRLGSSLYCLGECGAAWSAYRQAALISQGFKFAMDDEQLLVDPVVGKYALVLDRAFKRNKWHFDTERTNALLQMLYESGRGAEIVTKKWDTYLPYSWSVVSHIILHAIGQVVRGTIFRRMENAVECDTNSISANFHFCNHLHVADDSHLVGTGIVQLHANENGVAATASIKFPEKEAANLAIIPQRGARRKTGQKKKPSQKPALGNSMEDWDEDWDEDWAEEWDGDYEQADQ